MVPSLACDANLRDCVASLLGQDWEKLTIVVADNSGAGKAAAMFGSEPRVKVIRMPSNAGFGAAVNRGFEQFPADYLGTINDDAVAAPDCIRRLVEELEENPAAGMAAPKILLAGTDRLDSAGMNIAPDGSSRQRGHGEPEHFYNEPGEVLLPSGCAALYRAEMLCEIGFFPEDFFLYCEDTDLGLRARWAGWSCIFVPGARVVHRYSASAGRASALKAWLVERNRLRLVVRVFPASMVASSFLWAAARYFWHVLDLLTGHGKAAEFRRQQGGAWRLPWLVVRAHVHLAISLPQLLRQRREIAAKRRLRAGEFKAVLRRFSMPVRQVALW